MRAVKKEGSPGGEKRERKEGRKSREGIALGRGRERKREREREREMRNR